MGLYSLDQPYKLSTWYEAQGANDTWIGTDLMLDQAREIIDSDAYTLQLLAFPKGDAIMIEPQRTYGGTVNIVPNSYLVSMTAWSGNGNLFTVRIFDKGANTDLYYGQYAWYPTVVSNMTGSQNEGQFIVQGDQDIPFGPYFFRAPLPILAPGVLQIQLTNVQSLAGNPPGINQIQMLLAIAVPRNAVTQLNTNILTSSAQTYAQALSPLAETLLGMGN